MQKTLIALSLFFASLTPVWAGPYDNIARVEVVPGWRADDGRHIAGLRITLAPGWKTYWRSPGDAGIPPQIHWDGTGLAAASFDWPVPQVFDQGGARSIGYHDSVTVPVTLTPAPGQSGPLHLQGEMAIGVCEEICVPVTLAFDALLPEIGKRDAAILASLMDRPMTAAEAGAGPVTCSVTPISDGLRVTSTLTLPDTGAPEALVIEAGDPQVWVSEPATTRNGDTLTAVADFVHVSGQPFALDRSALRYTILGRNYAVDVTGCTSG